MRHKNTEFSPSVGVSNALELFLGLDTLALQVEFLLEERCWKVERCQMDVGNLLFYHFAISVSGCVVKPRGWRNSSGRFDWCKCL